MIILFAATYDVQNAFAFASDENQLNVTVDFIENTTATGYFMVLESTSGPPDAFVAVGTPDDTTRNVTVIDGIPASTYTMIVYDLEEDGLPNRSPAYEQSDSITVHGAGELFYTTQPHCLLLPRVTGA